MNRIAKVSLKILKWAGIVILSLIVLFFAARWIGQGVNGITPKGGINKSMYVDINGSRQWISIYGQNKDNPVLLYLHGGPGSASSPYDYAFTRKWADVYTVVTWDQRGCGKSYDRVSAGLFAGRKDYAPRAFLGFGFRRQPGAGLSGLLRSLHRHGAVHR